MLICSKRMNTKTDQTTPQNVVCEGPQNRNGFMEKQQNMIYVLKEGVKNDICDPYLFGHFFLTREAGKHCKRGFQEAKTPNPTPSWKWGFGIGVWKAVHYLWYTKAVLCRKHYLDSVFSKTQQLQKKWV